MIDMCFLIARVWKTEWAMIGSYIQLQIETYFEGNSEYKEQLLKFDRTRRRQNSISLLPWQLFQYPLIWLNKADSH